MPRVIIPSGSGEILFVTDQSASLDFRNNSDLRTGSGIIGKWEVDPDDESSIQFRIPKEKIGTSNDRIAFYISSSGRIGVGTKDPETAFDVRDNTEDVDPKDRTAKTKILKVSKTSQKFDTPVTASIISTSGNIIGDNITGKSLNIGSAFSVSSGGNITTLNSLIAGNSSTFDTHTIKGKTTINGNITASGNISSSGTIIASGLNLDAGTYLLAENRFGVSDSEFDFRDADVRVQQSIITTNLTASGNISASGNFIGNNIGPGVYDNRIYLTPADFFAQENPQSTRNDGGFIFANGGVIIDGGRRLKYYAQKVIPLGYEATHVLVKGSDSTNNLTVFSSSFTQDTAGQVGAAGTVNTELNFTSSTIVGGTNGTYCSVQWTAGSGNDKIFGGYIQVRPI